MGSTLHVGSECGVQVAGEVEGEGVARQFARHETGCRGKNRPRMGVHWARRKVGAGEGVAPHVSCCLMLWIVGVGSDCDP